MRAWKNYIFNLKNEYWDHYFYPELKDNNDYKEKGLERAKKAKIAQFRQQYKEIADKNFDEKKEVTFWIKHLQILYAELIYVKHAEQINESKFGFSLRLISNFVQQHIKFHPLYLEQIKVFKDQYEPPQKQLDDAKANANHAQPDERYARNLALINLVKLGDRDGTVLASQHSLLRQFNKPNRREFSSTEINNSALSRPAEIHPDVPWVFQENFRDLWEFRLKHHRFPNTKEEWNEWKSNPKNFQHSVSGGQTGTESPQVLSTLQITSQLSLNSPQQTAPTSGSNDYVDATQQLSTPANENTVVTPTSPSSKKASRPNVEEEGTAARISRSQQKNLAKELQTLNEGIPTGFRLSF